ncbi:hypothetical protein ES705_45788 [subsurface metagenome]
MAVAYDAVASDTVFNGTSFTTAAFTIDIGSIGNRAASVGLHHSSNDATSISVTVGGQSGSELADTVSSNNERVLLFGVKAPAQGSQTGSAAWTNSVSGVFGVITVTGADQSTTFNGAQTDVDNGSSNDIDLAMISNNGDLTITHCTMTANLATNQTGVYSLSQTVHGAGDYFLYVLFCQ